MTSSDVLATVDDIPEDILEYIILHLTPYGELQACRLVSRKWFRVASGAMKRLMKLFRRCDAFDWYLLHQCYYEGRRPSAVRVAQIAERCSHVACHHSSGVMFVFGGTTASYTTFNDLWAFDLASRSWSRPNPKGQYPTPKACATMVEYGGQLVLFGGWSKSSPNPIHQTAMFFNELHMYDPVLNTWQQAQDDGTAPHLAGHSSTSVRDSMVVFGGSYGTSSSNVVWIFDFRESRWHQAPVTGVRPNPRYGQSQVLLDDQHILIIGGCGGPNMIFSDAWLLKMGQGTEPWQWFEVKVTNPHQGAPQLWSHPACKVGNKLLVLSKALRSRSSPSVSHRPMSCSNRGSLEASGRSSGFVPPQGNLVPPRRKLLSSRSLDEKEPPPSPKSGVDRKITELQRARSIPAIIVGEIPKLVVTKEDNSGDSTGSDGSTGAADQPGPSSRSDQQPPRTPCITMAASSLLPNQATHVDPAPPEVAPPINQQRSFPSVRPNASADRSRQLELLQKMEQKIRSRCQPSVGAAGNSGAIGGDAPSTSGTTTPSSESSACSSVAASPKMRFRPSSPPPKSKHRRPANHLCSRNPMNIYVLELDEVITHKRVRWTIVDGGYEAAEERFLYSLVKGRGELIMFGGMRTGNPMGHQGLDVNPSVHSITNETFILRPPIRL